MKIRKVEGGKLWCCAYTGTARSLCCIKCVVAASKEIAAYQQVIYMWMALVSLGSARLRVCARSCTAANISVCR